MPRPATTTGLIDSGTANRMSTRLLERQFRTASASLPSHAPTARAGHYAGLDLLRILAAVLIFTQHGFSVTDLNHYNTVLGFRFGRLGTAILFVMSGFLAATTSRSPEAWLWRRLTRLYPAFWTVLLAGFAAAAITGRKSFDSLQVACEMAGIGFFTHGWDLVLVTTWFVSVFLAMIFLIYCARRFGHAAVIGLAIIGITVRSYMIGPYVAEYYGFALAFLIGYAMALCPRGSSPWLMTIVAFGALAAAGLPAFRYALCASLLLALVTRGTWPLWRLATKFPPIAYEWFLSHGLCLLFVCLWTKNPWIVLPVAAAASVPTAIAISRLTSLKYFSFRYWR